MTQKSKLKELEEDVKEFIKKLTEEEDSYNLNSAEAIQFRNAIQKERDKLAVKLLIKIKEIEE